MFILFSFDSKMNLIKKIIRLNSYDLNKSLKNFRTDHWIKPPLITVRINSNYICAVCIFIDFSQRSALDVSPVVKSYHISEKHTFIQLFEFYELKPTLKISIILLTECNETKFIRRRSLINSIIVQLHRVTQTQIF